MSKIKQLVEDAIKLTGENKSIAGRDEVTGEYEYDESCEVIDIRATLDNLNVEFDCDGECSECKLTKLKVCMQYRELVTREDILQGDFSELTAFYTLYLKTFKN